MTQNLRVAIVATSSVVSEAELAMGADSLRSDGFDVRVDPGCRRRRLFFAGSHENRASSLLEAVYSSEVDVVWCARGGYGSNHLLRMLDQETERRGPPRGRKLLIGSSDATSLLEFARTRWRLATLHAPMPGLRNFLMLTEEERGALLCWVRGGFADKPWGRTTRLKWLGARPKQEIRGTLVGGNLTVWNTLLGTPWQPHLKRGQPKILFLEDITEFLPRLDRSVRHLVDAGGLEGVAAVVLGNFFHCEDAVPQALAKVPSRWSLEQLRQPPSRWLAPLRRRFSQAEGLREIFGAISRETGVPVAHGLPVGHGPDHFSLPLGAQARVGMKGELAIERWSWIRS